MELEQLVFSVSSITLHNRWKPTEPVKEKYHYTVTNISGCSKKIKVCISKKSDNVSLFLMLIF
jgi:hypothetical protein